jgi:hypothetical protein
MDEKPFEKNSVKSGISEDILTEIRRHRIIEKIIEELSKLTEDKKVENPFSRN